MTDSALNQMPPTVRRPEGALSQPLSTIILQNILLKNIIVPHISYYLTMSNRNIVGSRVVQARKAAKPPITQKDLMARLEVLGMSIDQSTLSKIENQQRPVTDLEIVALSKALKVSAAWLIGEG